MQRSDVMVDFDQAVVDVVKISGDSPLGKFFMMNYVSGFPLTGTLEFYSTQKSNLEMKHDYRLPLPGAEINFWAGFKACFGGRDQYCRICINLLNWLNHYTILFNRGNERRFGTELAAFKKAQYEDAVLFLKPQNKFFKEHSNQIEGFYEGEYFTENAKRNDEQLRTQLHGRLHHNTNELALSVLCRIIGSGVLDLTNLRDAPPSFVQAFIKDPDTHRMMYQELFDKLENGIGKDRSTIGGPVCGSAWPNSNDNSKKDDLLLLHHILFYSNYGGKFKQVIGDILQGGKSQMAPYGNFSLKKMGYADRANSTTMLSENSAKQFTELVRKAQSWSPISIQEAQNLIKSKETTMFGKPTKTKGSGFS